MNKKKKDPNPFPYSDSNKRYHSYDYAMRMKYGGKSAKAILDAGFSCPNIDGKCGRGGCIYCSGAGSGDFTLPDLPLRRQFEAQMAVMSSKWDVVAWIPYLQAHTNTYAPIPQLRHTYEEILSWEETRGLSIATRADCLGEDVLELLHEVSRKTDLTVELGLQSTSDETARLIRRGHDYATFLDGYSRLRRLVPNCRIGVHIINGLPEEDALQMVQTAKDVAALKPDEVKIHLLHVMRKTPLLAFLEDGSYRPLERDEYVEITVKQLEYLPKEVVIGRLTGDSPADLLAAPLWSLKKLDVLNQIDIRMKKENTWQGRLAE
jgi:radical SAM protein (TIGR01212 family)